MEMRLYADRVVDLSINLEKKAGSKTSICSRFALSRPFKGKLRGTDVGIRMLGRACHPAWTAPLQTVEPITDSEEPRK